MVDCVRVKARDVEKFVGKFPIWVEYHIERIVDKLDGMDEQKRDRLLLEETAKLDRFCEILCTTNKNHIEAENEVYGDTRQFYTLMKRKNEARRKFLARMEETREKERLKEEKMREEQEKLRKEMEEPDENFPDKRLYLENDLTYKMREKLIQMGYKRLKTSPFGDSGAAYYWVNTRYNESKEHAFFCYLIQSEVEEKADSVTLLTNYGPDVEFKYNERIYCFDVETGKNLARNKTMIERKFLGYKERYFKSFIFITNKRLKYRYSKYGTVVTRATLKKTLESIFR